MNWRFFPTLDPQVPIFVALRWFRSNQIKKYFVKFWFYQVDLFVSRDLDSRLSDREQGAVQDWLHSNKSVHVMRDHINHDFPMVGCCWGTRLFDQKIRLKWKISWNNAINDTIMYSHHDSWGPDQIFLERCLTTSVEFFCIPNWNPKVPISTFSLL